MPPDIAARIVDNDYSVTQQAGAATQFDVYVDFQGGNVRRDLDKPTMLEGVEVGPVPAGFVLIPGVLHAYRASASDLAGYVKPERRHRGRDHDCDRDDDEITITITGVASPSRV